MIVLAQAAQFEPQLVLLAVHAQACRLAFRHPALIGWPTTGERPSPFKFVVTIADSSTTKSQYAHFRLSPSSPAVFVPFAVALARIFKPASMGEAAGDGIDSFGWPKKKLRAP